MSKYNIPTPKEVDYNNDKLFDSIMGDIVIKLQSRKFRFKPEYSYTKFKTRINEELKPHWIIVDQMVGSGPDNAYTEWEIKPCKEMLTTENY